MAVYRAVDGSPTVKRFKSILCGRMVIFRAGMSRAVISFWDEGQQESSPATFDVHIPVGTDKAEVNGFFIEFGGEKGEQAIGNRIKGDKGANLFAAGQLQANADHPEKPPNLTASRYEYIAGFGHIAPIDFPVADDPNSTDLRLPGERHEMMIQGGIPQRNATDDFKGHIVLS